MHGLLQSRGHYCSASTVISGSPLKGVLTPGKSNQLQGLQGVHSRKEICSLSNQNMHTSMFQAVSNTVLPRLSEIRLSERSVI